MTARTAQFVFTLSPRVISPAVDPGQLLAGHTLCPRCVRHEFLRSGQRDALVLEIGVAETFQGASVCDMGARGISCCVVSVDQYRGNIELRKKDASGSSTWP
jgi:hypothetical protein